MVSSFKEKAKVFGMGAGGYFVGLLILLGLLHLYNAAVSDDCYTVRGLRRDAITFVKVLNDVPYGCVSHADRVECRKMETCD